jgi:CRP/FNR family transcriptional regulator, anaerobic regulatory protein
MWHQLQSYLRKRMPLDDEQWEFIQNLLKEKQFSKGEFLLRAGEAARFGAFVSKGFLRSYVIKEGQEHIIQFAPEDWWVADMQSMITGQPASLYIDAIEDSSVLLLDRRSFEQIVKNIPAFGTSFQTDRMKHSLGQNERIISSLSADAHERYLDFIRKYPTIAERVPQHMLASYLGMSPETLSRVKKR